MRAESKLAEFMDSYLYSRITPTKDDSKLKYERKHDAKEQLEGIDVCIDVDSKKFLIDEKAALYYSNADIDTFAFEINSLQRGWMLPVEGWFVNYKLRTEYYMLIWPNVKCDRKRGWVRKEINALEKDDFTIVETMLISKEKLIHKMNELGYNKQKLLDYARVLRETNSEDNKHIEDTLEHGIRIRISTHKAEKPVNVLIPKKILKELAEKRYFVSKEGCASFENRGVAHGYKN